MYSFPRSHPQARTARLCVALTLTLALGACKSIGDVTGSIRPASVTAPTDDASLRAYAETWGRKYDQDPGNKTAALTYAAALRRLTQYSQATAVLQRAAAKFPDDMEVLGAYGKALADAGRWQEAADVLSRAHTPERPNWSILSAQGSVADQLGNHAAAQEYYQAALKIVPEQPSVLSNLGLSYALAKDLRSAEQAMQRAVDQPAADMRVRQNFALVLALQGKFSEAEAVSRRDLPAQEAAANVAAIRQMIAQSDTWRDIQKLDTQHPRKGPASASR
ncbi:MAG: hypothetical protein JWM36_656 [Hyphomicrobiales bacterium]|nr:hypothetical protein [Hyphomicrobiales bacterium]